MKPSFYLIIGIFVICIMAIPTCNQFPTSIVTCKILNLQSQQILSGEPGNASTHIRYIVITDRGTFVSETSVFHWKFNNSEIFYNLNVGSVYTMKVAGVGKSLLTDYKNIIKIYDNKQYYGN